MTIKAWPFLISRNKTLDYRVIVAPDYVSERDFSEFVSLTAGDMTEPNVSVWRQMRTANGQVLTLIFRVEQAWVNDERARDGYGRLIACITGFVLEGSEKEVPVAGEVFEELNEKVRTDYRKFWNLSEHVSVARSESLSLIFDQTSHKLILFSQKDLRARPVTNSPLGSREFDVRTLLSTLKIKLMSFFISR